QAEDGIRDRNVTGVQTCALPIFTLRLEFRASRDAGIVADLELVREGLVTQVQAAVRVPGGPEFQAEGEIAVIRFDRVDFGDLRQIGRASCRGGGCCWGRWGGVLG